MSESNDTGTLVPFEYGNVSVRTILIGGEPWFVLADLCKVLEITRSASNVAQRLDSDGVRQAYPIIDSLGRTQNVIMVNESAMYEVVIRSDKQEAAKFRRWITTEVLPAIRKTGSYVSAHAPMSQIDVLRAALDQIEAAERDAAEAKSIATKTDARLDAIEGRHDWFAALGYARLHGFNTSAKFLKNVGNQATTIAGRHGIKPVKVPHALYGEVNSYPAWVWEIAFDGRKS